MLDTILEYSESSLSFHQTRQRSMGVCRLPALTITQPTWKKFTVFKYLILSPQKQKSFDVCVGYSLNQNRCKYFTHSTHLFLNKKCIDKLCTTNMRHKVASILIPESQTKLKFCKAKRVKTAKSLRGQIYLKQTEFLNFPTLARAQRVLVDSSKWRFETDTRLHNSLHSPIPTEHP